MTSAEILMVAEQYRQDRNSLTEKDKAVRERALWAMAGPEIRKVEFRRDFLKRLLNEPTSGTQYRQTILAIGEAGEPLWRRIHEKQLLLGTGADLASKAKKMERTQNVELSIAVLEALKEYDSLPFTRLVDGVPVRIPGPKGRSTPEEQPTFQHLDTGRQFWLDFRATVTTYFEKKCEWMDSSTREILKREFETDLKVLIEQFQSKIHNAQKREKGQREVALVALTRSKILDACTTLHMDPPAVGGQVDMDKARKQKKLLARAYHPDSNGGDSTTQEKYIAVMQAFQVLETYSKQTNAAQLHVVPQPVHRSGNES